MTKRTRILLLPLTAAGLLLAACGSTTTESAAPASAAVTVVSPEADEPMEPSTDDSASEAMASDAVPMDSADAVAPASGAYISLAEYEGSADMYAAGDVVLFFAADWCPTCQEATANLTNDPSAIPSGLTIVRVDYDDSDDLKQRYGVTTQHTFVQVDTDGNEIAKWTGSVTADQIAKQTT